MGDSADSQDANQEDSPRLLSDRQIREIFPSDQLAVVRDLADALLSGGAEEGTAASVDVDDHQRKIQSDTAGKAFRLRPYSLDLILDANAVLRDIRFLVKNQTNPEARTDLQETIDAGTVRAFAPEFLRDEIAKNIPEIAERDGLSENRYWEEWEEYQPRITFEEVCDGAIHVAGQSIDVADEKDLPYIVLQVKTGALIQSEDSHIEEMGGETLNPDVIKRLRDYSRRASVKYVVTYGGTAVTVAAFAMAKQLAEAIAGLVQQLRRLPPVVQLILAAIAFMVLLHPTSRSAIQKKVYPMIRKTGQVSKEAAVNVLLPLLMQAHSASEEAEKELQEALARIGEEPADTRVLD
jgi:predicted nucleic acid-binding protein